MTKITMHVADANCRLTLVDYYTDTSSHAAAVERLYSLAKIHFMQVLDDCIRYESEDDSFTADIEALRDVASHMSSRLFCDCVHQLFDMCEIRIETMQSV